MRPLATWAVVGALAVLGLFAVRDALTGDDAPASDQSAPQQFDRPRLRPVAPAPARPPRIVSRERLAGELRALGARGVLYLTNAKCRRFILRLPELVWTTPEGLPGPDCTTAPRQVVDQRFGVVATQVAADIIEARSGDWRLRFQGNDPTFTPEGTLTFLRAGRLFGWSVRCPAGESTTIFQGIQALERCPRSVPGAPNRLHEVVWLNVRDYAAVAGQEYAPTLLVVRNGRTHTLFQALGARMGALEASPGGRYVAVRIDENLVTFDTQSGDPALLPPGADGPLRAIAWTEDDRYGVIASRYSLHVYRASTPQNAITLPLSAVDVDWR
jgi:hypothetical protein